MTTNRGPQRVPSRTPPFILVGLVLVLAFLGFNYWSLTSSNSTLTAQLETVNIEKRDFESIHNDLKKSLESSKSSVVAIQLQANELRENVESKENQINSLKAELSQKLADSDKQINLLDQCDEKLTVIQKDLEASNAEKANLQILLDGEREKIHVCNMELCKSPVKQVLDVAAKLVGSEELKQALRGAHIDADSLMEGFNYPAPTQSHNSVQLQNEEPPKSLIEEMRQEEQAKKKDDGGIHGMTTEKYKNNTDNEGKNDKIIDGDKGMIKGNDSIPDELVDSTKIKSLVDNLNVQRAELQDLESTKEKKADGIDIKGNANNLNKGLLISGNQDFDNNTTIVPNRDQVNAQRVNSDQGKAHESQGVQEKAYNPVLENSHYPKIGQERAYNSNTVTKSQERDYNSDQSHETAIDLQDLHDDQAYSKNVNLNRNVVEMQVNRADNINNQDDGKNNKEQGGILTDRNGLNLPKYSYQGKLPDADNQQQNVYGNNRNAGDSLKPGTLQNVKSTYNQVGLNENSIGTNQVSRENINSIIQREQTKLNELMLQDKPNAFGTNKIVKSDSQA